MIKVSKQYEAYETVTSKVVVGPGLQTQSFYSDSYGTANPAETILIQVDSQILAICNTLQSMSSQLGGLNALAQLLPQLQMLSAMVLDIQALVVEYQYEKTMREPHPTVKSAFDTYKMALKLCSDPNAT